MTRRPRYRIRESALWWYMILTLPADGVLSAVIARTVTGRPDGTATTVVFFATFAALATVTIWAGERYLPKEQHPDMPCPECTGDQDCHQVGCQQTTEGTP